MAAAAAVVVVMLVGVCVVGGGIEQHTGDISFFVDNPFKTNSLFRSCSLPNGLLLRLPAVAAEEAAAAAAEATEAAAWTRVPCAWQR